ncbi:UNVERIFIED_CONTAM: hypothetical protein GTU68_061699 [Idotea baltica]|nr:hypothetical protein [Idotea baltica]
MLKIGVGPSSSHTLGPWKAILIWLESLHIDKIVKLKIHLYGSLAKTGTGHGTDIAILMGLLGEQPETTNTELISNKVQAIIDNKTIVINGIHKVNFSYQNDLIFHFTETLPFHANGLHFEAFDEQNITLSSEKYYSVGGGFIVQENDKKTPDKKVNLKYPCNSTANLLQHCEGNNITIAEMVFANELSWRTATEINETLLNIWTVMKACIYKGCYTHGQLPGGLEVKRRAAEINQQLIDNKTTFNSANEWIVYIRNSENEENAALGRVVTAPTNGAAGVIPTVIMYLICFSEERNNCIDEAYQNQLIIKFLSIAAEIGTFFKRGATISAAMGGCQAEIGVSSAMAAGALTECLGGSVQQALMAAEIAMEHHLGLTCDPVGGLVQIPCIERNSMGAIKAITAANIALESNPKNAKVSLDNVINTMWETAKDMNSKYKETAEGGLATNISVNMVEC